MIALASILVLGFFLGMRHATDPDHVIAVTTIVSRRGNVQHATVIGALWGLGHTITIFLVGSAIILFGVVIPPRVGLTMELSVGLMLILLGVLNLSGVLRWITERLTPESQGVHSHTHSHGGVLHSHPHWHAAEAPSHGHEHEPANAPDVAASSAKPIEPATVGRLDRWFGQLGPYQTVRPLAVGIVHGMAGSAAVALLVLTTIRAPLWAVLYLLLFGVGTIAGMMCITAAIAVPFAYSERRFARMNRSLAAASGFISLAFGLFIVYQMGYVNGLLSVHPNWTPR